MKQRLFFHFLNFIVLCLFLVLSTVIYFYFSPHTVDPLAKVLSDFFSNRWHNFALIGMLTYFSIYLTGMVKYTIEDKFFRVANYLRELFKFLMILGMVAFVEFFLFFSTRVGRSIYFYLFVMYSIYYFSYLVIRSHKGRRKLLWLAPVPVKTIVEKYISAGAFDIVEADREAEVTVAPNVSVVYQGGSINEYTTESLIKNKLAGNTVIELVELIEKESGTIPVDYVNIHWFLEKFDVADRNFFRVNRFFNIILALLLLVTVFPLGLLVALVHKLFSKGPVFFIQERVGLHGKAFKLIKFRTMVVEAEKDGARFSGKGDTRITSLGRFMRRLRIDEIPQFINVLKGEMSMVGPRPEREVFIESLAKEIPYYKLRLLVPPGLTGWAQINCAYAGSDVADHKDKLEHDLYYIKNRSVFSDMLILLQTIKTILLARGA
ncbi:MAG: hypothetical protein GY765_31390 [bacterium]|nr:hypothetical protein [bacterium]